MLLQDFWSHADLLTIFPCTPAVVSDQYFVGYGIAYGGTNPFIGAIGSNFGNFALSGVVDTGATHAYGYDWVMFFFQYCFCAACATIVSGAVAERCELVAYLAYCFIIIGLV